MKKSGQEANVFGIPTPTLDLLQPQAILESFSKVTAQIEDLNRTMMGSMQRSVDSAWELSAQLARSNNPTDATRLCREWLDERRDAFFADGKQISSLLFKLYETLPTQATGAPSALSSMSRAVSAAE